MSVGGIFKLITNDGKQDRMLMATALLNRRLMDIEKMRSANPAIKDPTPTLVDIERTHILFMNAHFKPFAAIGYEYSIVKASGVVTTGSSIQFSLPQFGDFFNDMVLHVILGAIPTYNSTLLRYIDYPGMRLIETAAFTVNGNPLDNYNYVDNVIYRKMYVGVNQRAAYDRCVGQQPTLTGHRLITNDDAYQYNYSTFANGFQTPNTTQPELEMYIPLQFWFNLDPRLAIPSVAIPYGQRYIDLHLASGSTLLKYCTIGDTETFYDYPSELPIRICELMINNIFVNPEIHDIYIRRIGFSLIRVHLSQDLVALNKDNILANRLKWPIETIYFFTQPTAQQDSVDGWYHYSKQTKSTWSSLTVNWTVPQYQRIIQNLDVKAHGITLYHSSTAAFYADYIPLTYSGSRLTADEDGDLLMINFNLYPGSYQPSGHINVSRAREFYINYTINTDVIDYTDTAGMVYIHAIAINFLLISDGSAILRYST